MLSSNSEQEQSTSFAGATAQPLKLSVIAEFYTKAANPSTQESSPSQGKANSYIFAGIKHSGSLILIGSDGSFSTKNAADPKFTNTARLLFDTWMGDKGPTLLSFLKENRLSLGLELVCPRFLGDHAQIPKLAYFAVTCVTALEVGGGNYSLPELIKFCHQHGLPYGEYYFFKTNEKIGNLDQFRRELGVENLKNTLALKEKLKQIVEGNQGKFFPGNIPHEEVQGDLAEGVVAWEFECESSYNPIVDMSVFLEGNKDVGPNFQKESLKKLEEMGERLSTFYNENKYDDSFPQNGRPKDKFWEEIKQILKNNKVEERVPDKTGKLLDNKEKIEVNEKEEYPLNSNGLIKLFSNLDSEVYKEKFQPELAKLVKKSEQVFKKDFFHLKKLFITLEKTLPLHLIQDLAKPFIETEGSKTNISNISNIAKCISVKVYKNGDDYRIHVKLKNDSKALKQEAKIGRGFILALSPSSLSETNQNKIESDALKNSKKLTKKGRALKVKLPVYAISRGQREAWFSVENTLRDTGPKKIIYQRALDQFLKGIKKNLEPLLSQDKESFLTECNNQLKELNKDCNEEAVKLLVNDIEQKYKSLIKENQTQLDKLFSPEEVVNSTQLFNYLIVKRFKESDERGNGDKPEDKKVQDVFLSSYFLFDVSCFKAIGVNENNGVQSINCYNKTEAKKKFCTPKKLANTTVVALVYSKQKPKRLNEAYKDIPVINNLRNSTEIQNKSLSDNEIKNIKKDDPSFILKDSFSISDKTFKSSIESLLKKEIEIVLIFKDIPDEIKPKQKEDILKTLQLNENDNITLLHKRANESSIKYLSSSEEASGLSKPPIPATSSTSLFLLTPAPTQTEEAEVLKRRSDAPEKVLSVKMGLQ